MPIYAYRGDHSLPEMTTLIKMVEQVAYLAYYGDHSDGQNLAPAPTQVWGRRLKLRFIFLCHFNGGRKPKNVAPDISMKVWPSGPTVSLKYFRPMFRCVAGRLKMTTPVG